MEEEKDIDLWGFLHDFYDPALLDDGSLYFWNKNNGICQVNFLSPTNRVLYITVHTKDIWGYGATISPLAINNGVPKNIDNDVLKYRWKDIFFVKKMVKKENRWREHDLIQKFYWIALHMFNHYIFPVARDYLERVQWFGTTSIFDLENRNGDLYYRHTMLKVEPLSMFQMVLGSIHTIAGGFQDVTESDLISRWIQNE